MTDERSLADRPAARPSQPAPAASDGGATAPTRSSGCGVGCLVFIGVVVVVIIIFTFLVSGSGEGHRDNSGGAVLTCKNLVEKNLKAPSTASYPRYPSVTGNTITGQVDSENGFGANIRSDFQCTIDGDMVRLDYVR